MPLQQVSLMIDRKGFTDTRNQCPIGSNGKGKTYHLYQSLPTFVKPGTNIMRGEFTYDGLHLSKSGYDVWAKELKKEM